MFRVSSPFWGFIFKPQNARRLVAYLYRGIYTAQKELVRVEVCAPENLLYKTTKSSAYVFRGPSVKLVPVPMELLPPMTTMNGVKDGVPNAPPYPPHPVDGVQRASDPMSVIVDESPPTKFVFQAKIEANCNRNETFPFQLKSLLIALLVQHQRVDHTFYLLPTEDGSTRGAITKAYDIPNTEKDMKAYVKEMHDINNRNSSHHTVVFFLKVASSMTLG